jgi:hypothetical protein
LSVTVPSKVVKDIYNDVIKEYSKKAKVRFPDCMELNDFCCAIRSNSDWMLLNVIQVPGFRPGKRIPESVLVNYIGPQAVRSSAVEAILKKSLPEALSSVGYPLYLNSQTFHTGGVLHCHLCTWLVFAQSSIYQ